MREIELLCVENHPEYTSALQYMLEKRALRLAAGAQKLQKNLWMILSFTTPPSWGVTLKTTPSPLSRPPFTVVP